MTSRHDQINIKPKFKSKILLKDMIFLKVFQELSFKKSMEIFLKKPLNHSSLLFKEQV